MNCRGWWSREVDIKLTFQELKLDVLGLAETFLREEDEASVAGYVWYGRNREGCKRASGGVSISHVGVPPLVSFPLLTVVLLQYTL